jgi:hypothetical protein
MSVLELDELLFMSLLQFHQIPQQAYTKRDRKSDGADQSADRSNIDLQRSKYK